MQKYRDREIYKARGGGDEKINNNYQQKWPAQPSLGLVFALALTLCQGRHDGYRADTKDADDRNTKRARLRDSERDRGWRSSVRKRRTVRVSKDKLLFSSAFQTNRQERSINKEDNPQCINIAILI